ncbi:MAG: hypothetical protein ACREH4_00760, partial [Vitreimonas sp.]
MARIRTIKPEFPQAESMGRVSRDARLLFILLWTLSDDHGRTRAASRALASLLYPYDDDAPGLIDGWLAELEREGCIERYQVDAKSYLHIVNWQVHQKIDRPSASKFPEPPPDPREASRSRAAGSRTLVGGSRIKEGTKDQAHSEAEASDAGASQHVVNGRQEIFDAGTKILVDAGIKQSRARSMLGKWCKAHSDEAVMAAIRQVQGQSVAEPVSFITACLKA